ncbi:MAG: Uma2 family endonuclease, partial [Blastocatellia bacterium]
GFDCDNSVRSDLQWLRFNKSQWEEPDMSAVMELALDNEKSYEIVNGQPEEKEMAGGTHGAISANIVTELGIYQRTHKRGVVVTEVNFKIGENERIPDVAFVVAKRVPPGGMPVGVVAFAPDIAIEVISPNDVHDKVSEKVLEYLEAGVRQVWLISQKLRSVTIWRSLTEAEVFAGDRELVSEDLLPGFRCSLNDVFDIAQAADQN